MVGECLVELGGIERLDPVPECEVGRRGLLGLERHDPLDRVDDGQALAMQQHLPGERGAVELTGSESRAGRHGRSVRGTFGAGGPVIMSAMDETYRLRELADLVPVLEAPDANFGHWDHGPSADGGAHLPWFVPGPTEDAFRSAVGRGGWVVVGFDWMQWLQTDEGRALRDDPGALATASADQLGMLLTAIVRSDRFTEGSIAGAFESGLLARIARRAASLLEARR